ncbi:MAG: transposase [Bdellovibrionales bacterium]|nr:transposase [Bdellovibrionales bacterium]
MPQRARPFFLEDAREEIDTWRWRYKNITPHSALGTKSPIEFVNEQESMFAS